LRAVNDTMTDSNSPLLTALTWGTVIAALVSALLLAAAGPGLPTHDDAQRPATGREAAANGRQMQATNGQRSPAGASSTRTH
jgi:hypothetical protein